MELPFFPETDAETSVLRAAGTLRIADGVRLLSADGTPADATNTGAGLTEIGADSQLGNVASAGPVTLRSRSQITGTVRSAQGVTQQSGVHVSNGVQTNVAYGPLPTYRFTLEVPAAETTVSLEPGQSRDLVPGSYLSLTGKSRSHLRLSPGTYYTRSLQLEPQATIDVLPGDDPVIIWVVDNLNYKGSVPGSSEERFFLGYLGTNPVSLEGPFSGTVVAPNAALRLAPLNGAEHRGSFFAKSIDAAEARTTLRHVPFRHWDKVFNVEPQVHCVRRYANGHAAALFGYDNHSGFPVHIPSGPSNSFDIVSPNFNPPAELIPGSHPRAFWGAIPVNRSLRWRFGGRGPRVGGGHGLSNIPSCHPGDTPPSDPPSQDPDALVQAESLKGVPLSLIGQIPDDVKTEGYSQTSTLPASGFSQSEDANPEALGALPFWSSPPPPSASGRGTSALATLSE